MRTAITLPLPTDMNRCKGEGPLVGALCARRDNCARYLSIFKDERPLPAYFGICISPSWHGHVPMEGYPDREAEA